MEFRLIYEGHLPGQAGKAQHKWLIRRQLHPQLAKLWMQQPLSANASTWLAFPPKPDKTSVIVPRGPARFAPLVTSRLNLYAELSIVIFRRQPRGTLLLGGGDLDNRTKTLVDGLRLPSAAQEFGQGSQLELPNPFFCLLEDDSLVTKVTVESEQLLTEGSGADALAVITVQVKKTHSTWDNVGL